MISLRGLASYFELLPRSEGVLVIAGGLIIHTFQDFSAFVEKTAKPIYKEFDRAVNDASLVSDVSTIEHVFTWLIAPHAYLE